MKSKMFSTIHTVASFTILLGCLASFAGQEVREEFQQNYPFDRAGKVWLENVNGNVRIATWDRAELKLDAVKRAKNQTDLDQAKIEVDARADRMHIKTTYLSSQKHKNNSASVDYTLTVPRESNLAKISTVNGSVEIESVTGKVEASSVNGQVKATGLANEANLSSVNGSVNASFVELKSDVALKSVNGGVTIAVPQETDAHISASSSNGGISTDFALQAKSHFPVGKNLDAKLGKGGPAIKMSSVNGAIRINRSTALALEAR
jgi:DUF4097 and DUF4098 domain-containing protein YvlB